MEITVILLRLDSFIAVGRLNDLTVLEMGLKTRSSGSAAGINAANFQDASYLPFQNPPKAAMVPLGWPTGRWGIAERRPLQEMVYLERWGRAPGWAVDGPLWPDPAVNTSKGAR